MNNSPDSSKGPGRRGFLRGSAAALTALSYSRVAARAAGSEPSDTIRVAISGCGQISTYALIPSLQRMKAVSVTALCDVWPYKLASAQRQVSAGNRVVQGFGNMDEMLERAGKDFDTVVVATPCWMHAPQTRKALEAGKHVYCEKTMSNTVEAARDMVRAQRQTGKLLQIGHQRRSNPRYLHLRDKIIGERKLLGQITHLSAHWHRSVRQPILPRIAGKDLEAIKAAGYSNALEFSNWRWFKKYGGGPVSDLGGHQVDVFNMLLGVPPRSVIGSGGLDYYKGGEYEGQKYSWEHLDNAMVIYEYDVPGHGLVRAQYQVLSTTGYEGYREKVHGVEGTALISEQFRWENGGPELVGEERYLSEDRVAAWEKAESDGVLSKSTQPRWPGVNERPGAYDFPPQSKEEEEKIPHHHHLENFLDAVRRDQKQSDLACPAEEAFKTCVAVLAINDAVREQRRIELKPEDYTVI